VLCRRPSTCRRELSNAPLLCARRGLSSHDPSQEDWRYSAPYEDTVAFLRDQFATGRRYDAHGATWWKGLPPCYYEHQSPPWGLATFDAFGKPDGTVWRWSDGANSLNVEVWVPVAGTRPSVVSIYEGVIPPGRADPTCYRA
jgi:hypothetical protein